MRIFIEPVDDADNAVFDKHHLEIDEQAQTLVGEPPYPNAKVFSLSRMLAQARHELLVMADSDIRVSPDFLATLAAELEDAGVGLITCPYRAVPDRSFWSMLEAIGINTEFMGSALVARMLNGMDFALGCGIAARRNVLERIDGFAYLKDLLAEDFVMGKRVSELSCRVLFSSCVIEHHIGVASFANNLKHRLHWARSTRRSRPLGIRGPDFHLPAAPGGVVDCATSLLVACAPGGGGAARGCSHGSKGRAARATH